MVYKFGAPQQILTGFACWLCYYCTDVAQQTSTKFCMMFGRFLCWYTMRTFSEALAAKGILPGVKFTLRLSLAFSYISSVIALHSGNGLLQKLWRGIFTRQGGHLVLHRAVELSAFGFCFSALIKRLAGKSMVDMTCFVQVRCKTLTQPTSSLI